MGQQLEVPEYIADFMAELRMKSPDKREYYTAVLAALHHTTNKWGYYGSWASQSGFLYFGQASTPDNNDKEPVVFYLMSYSAYSSLGVRAWEEHLRNAFSAAKVEFVREDWSGNGGGGCLLLPFSSINESVLQLLVEDMGFDHGLYTENSYEVLGYETPEYEALREKEEATAYEYWWEDVIRHTPFEGLAMPSFSAFYEASYAEYQEEGEGSFYFPQYHGEKPFNAAQFVVDHAVSQTLAGEFEFPSEEDRTDFLATLKERSVNSDTDYKQWLAVLAAYETNPITTDALSGRVYRRSDMLSVAGQWRNRAEYEAIQPRLPGLDDNHVAT